MLRSLGLAGLVLFLAACDPQTGTSIGGIGSSAPTIVSAIGDTPWHLVRVGDEDVSGENVVLKMAGGFISGQGPCNVLNANYLGEAPEFRVETLVSTKMMCDRLGLEQRLIDGLMNARNAKVANRRLTITGQDAPTLVFEPA
ncbi:META domain-containing protein [Paroceanicella profunda]|uniref:META domain-containing protein n=1 Tax=Paroceanicella profunda TaxID=2579971 RepID=A0A5B8FH99_9RHOB|nr:META domain-containing protein [Paroceanicella profunda]QDL92191.1 META domain-containing protein [Paroceanicella profunda]